jgi:predicted phosphodiesterase
VATTPWPCPMDRVLIIGDTHGNAPWIETVLLTAQRLGITTAIQLGDFGIWPGESGSVFVDQVQQAAERTGVAIYAMTGNHDDQVQIGEFEEDRDVDGFVTLGPNLRWIPRGQRWTWEGITFGALGGAFSVDHRWRTNGVDWWAGAEEVRPDDVDRLGVEPLDVLLTHDAPQGAHPPDRYEIPIIDASQSQISRGYLRQAVVSTGPQLVIHGHWHVRQTRELHIGNLDRAVRVEGLASDQEHDGGAWGVLDLNGLNFVDGEHVLST